MSRYTYKTDPYNIPQLPVHAVAVATLTGVAADDVGRPGGFSVMVTGAGTVVATPQGRDTAITLTYTADMIAAGFPLLPFRCASLDATGTATVVILF